MAQLILKNKFSSLLDLIGFSASTLCAIHCALLPLVLSFLPLLGMGFLGTQKFEWIMLLSSIAFAMSSFLRGYYKHHKHDEPISLMLIAFIFFMLGYPRVSPVLLNEISLPIGGFIMAYAHYRNWKLCKEKNCEKCN
jgi:hypothetical protein